MYVVCLRSKKPATVAETADEHLERLSAKQNLGHLVVKLG
jgi:hypothetical protein